jgi:hypothetical protein
MNVDKIGSSMTPEEWAEVWPVYDFVHLLESFEVSFGCSGDELQVVGPSNVLFEYQDRINEYADAIIQIVRTRPFGPPLVQDPKLFEVPHYTDWQKHEMTEAYIRKLQAEPRRDDEPLIIEDGELIEEEEKTHDERFKPRAPHTRTTGICFYCWMPLEADQPGGRNPRHVHNQVPYGQCPEALEMKG